MIGVPTRIERDLRALLTGSAFIFFWSGGAALSWIVLPLVHRRALSDEEKRRRSQDWVQWGFRVFWGYLRGLGLSDFDPGKVELDHPEEPFVMIANHPTLVDVTAVMSVAGRLSCVVGRAYYKLPMVRRLMDYAGHIDGGDGGSMASALVVVKALEHIAEGRSVLIFPEGTRSPELGLHPFQRGAFELARRAGVPIVPVFITSDPPTLMKHQRWYEVPPRPLSLRVRRLDDREPEVPSGSSERVAETYHRRFVERLEAWLARGRTGEGGS